MPREGLRLEAEKARISAVKALEDYQRFLQSDLLPRSSGDWRLGQERYHKKFSLALQTDLTPESVVIRAESAFKTARLELFQLAVQLHKELFPGRASAHGCKAVRKTRLKIIRAVRDELSKDHPKAEELVEAHRRNLDGFPPFHRRA